MRELVDPIHARMWAVAERAALDIDPVALRRAIAQQVSEAQRVASPEALTCIGPARLAVMIDVATRYELSLAELLMEALDAGADNAASLCREAASRRTTTRRRPPPLTLVE